jgi:hypothetical protein
MMVYQEKIAPPARHPPDEEQMKLNAESLARDDRWVKNLIDGLAGILRDDGCMSFSPWHGLTAHQPLGSIMRVRKAAYEMSADFRTERNGCPMQQGRPLETLP